MKSGKLLSRYGHGRKDTLLAYNRINYFLVQEIHAPIEKDKCKGIEYIIIVKFGLLTPAYTYAYTAHKEEKDGKLFLVPDKGINKDKHRYIIECNACEYLGAL